MLLRKIENHDVLKNCTCSCNLFYCTEKLSGKGNVENTGKQIPVVHVVKCPDAVGCFVSGCVGAAIRCCGCS